MEKEVPKLLINGEYTVAVSDIDQFKGHGSSALHSVEITTGRAETAMATERDEF